MAERSGGDRPGGVSRARLRELRSLRERRGRVAQGLQLLEGPRLVGEAVAAHMVTEIFVDLEETRQSWESAAAGVPVHRIARADLERLTDVRSAPGVVAIGPRPLPRPAERILAETPRVLYLDGVQDPGNVGTLARTARAFGLGACLAGPGSADLSAPKVLRAAAGALFYLDLGQGEGLESLLPLARRSGHRMVVPVVRGGVDLRRVEPPARYILVAGNEGRGAQVLERTPEVLRLTIPMTRGVESLNVAAAVAVILGRWYLEVPF